MIYVKVLNNPEIKELGLPKYETEGSSGVDLKSAIDIVVPAGERKLVGTGLKIAIPKGSLFNIYNKNIPNLHAPYMGKIFNDALDICYEAQIRPRSGLALKKGITVLNTPGTVDESYRGEIGVIIFNTSKEDFEIKKGDRIAQMVFVPIVKADFKLVETLDETERGEGGFGSTGEK